MLGPHSLYRGCLVRSGPLSCVITPVHAYHAANLSPQAARKHVPMGSSSRRAARLVALLLEFASASATDCTGDLLIDGSSSLDRARMCTKISGNVTVCATSGCPVRTLVDDASGLCTLTQTIYPRWLSVH
jgi:hypothetical protein